MLIVGSIPSAGKIGGVTIHVGRLVDGLKEHNYPFIQFGYKEKAPLHQLILFLKNKAAHLHVSNPILRVLYVFLGRLTRTKTILTIHGNLGRFNTFKNYMDRIAVTFCNVPVLINENSFSKALKWNRNAKLIPAFIPPHNEPDIPSSIRDTLLAQKQSGRKIVITNAFARNFNDFGKEIYGIDFLIKYFSDKKEFALLISDPSGQYSSYYPSLPKNIFIITEQHSFYRLIQESDIVVRDTVTDGDSLSVKEALYAQKPMLASDVVERPCGTVLFHYNDAKSLTEALGRYKDSKTPSEFDDSCVEKLLQIYSELEK